MTRQSRAKPRETIRRFRVRSSIAPASWARTALGAGLVFAVSASFFAGSGKPALAWGRMAHRASARFVESRLSPQARAIVRDLLEPGESLADAATWPDENSREIPGSAAWHFVNVRVSSAHYDPKDCRNQGCVVTKIAEFRTILADRHATRSRRRMALRFFVHLVQDLHQPMHVADRNDRGGNNLQLRYGRYDNTNLHQVWDSGLLGKRYRRETDLLHDLEDLANQPESRNWLKGRVEDWADESLEVGRRAYVAVPGSNVMLRPGDAISRDYENENLPAVVERVARSGVRLASMLNEILKP